MAALALAPIGARAATVVTVCGSVTAPGGVNLASALETGGDIVVRCPGGSGLIQFSGQLILRHPATIDGEGHLTLIGPGHGVMFALDGPLKLTLRGLTVRNPVDVPSDSNRLTAVVYDPADERSVELDNVTVSDTRLPFVVRSFVAENSTFKNNGDKSNPDLAVVMAGDMTLAHAIFQDNLGRPFAAVWRGDPLANGRKIDGRITDSTFTHNARAGFWAVGTLSVDNSRFERNGADGPLVHGASGQLYGGAVYLELASSLGGALEIYHGKTTISHSTFLDNHGAVGGAITALLSTVALESSEFDANRGGAGGAIAFVAPDGQSRLSLDHVKLRGNGALTHGGALFVQGAVDGDAALFSANTAAEDGGAIAFAATGVTAPPQLQNLMPPPPAGYRSALALSRGIFVDNKAKAGGAIEGAQANLRLGNALLARNLSSATSSGAIDGSQIELANATIVGNMGGGLSVSNGPGLRIANSIVAVNGGGNCRASAGVITAFGPNLGYPDQTCGAGGLHADPALDADFRPSAASPARSSGAGLLCATHDLVLGRDVYGDARGATACTLGAVEADTRSDLRRMLPISIDTPTDLRRLLCYLLGFLVFFFLVGLLLGWRRRQRRRRDSQKGRDADAS